MIRWLALMLLLAGPAFAQGYRPNVSLQISNSQRVSPDLFITPYALYPQAGPGEAALKPAHDGARIYVGTDSQMYFYSDGLHIISNGAFQAASMEVDTVGIKTPGRQYNEYFAIRYFPFSSLGTCNGSTATGGIPEGTVKLLSGAAASGRSRLCVCSSDGGGTPAYSWMNTGCPTAAGGTSTSCPACP